MDTLLLIKALVAVAPVLLLLVLFARLDTFELVTFAETAALTVGGGLVAAAALAVNAGLLSVAPLSFRQYSQFVAPVVEESLKAAPILYLFAVNRLGFKLDSAVAGFAVGAGFSMAENGWFLYFLNEANITSWLVRGFGTAVMHGGATALFAIISHEMTEYQAEANATAYRFNPMAFIPGLAAAIAVHGLYNYFPNEGLVAMVTTLLFVPLTLFFVFARGHLAAHRWVKADHDLHVKVLQELRTGMFLDTSVGQELASFAEKVQPGSTDEAYSLGRLSLELVLRAEEIMLAREAGKATSFDRGEADKFEAMNSLRGRLDPKLIVVAHRCTGISRNDLWEISRLEVNVRRAARRRRR